MQYSQDLNYIKPYILTLQRLAQAITPYEDMQDLDYIRPYILTLRWLARPAPAEAPIGEENSFRYLLENKTAWEKHLVEEAL